MAKKIDTAALTDALNTLTFACNAYANASASITAALCAAFVAGATEDEWGPAAQCGFETAGHDLPQGFMSNARRLAAAGPKYWKKAAETGLGLNNRLLLAIDAPKRSAAGKPTSSAKATAPATAPAAGSIDTPVETPALVMALRTVQDINSKVLTFRTGKGEPLPASAAAKVQELMAEAAAIMGQFVK